MNAIRDLREAKGLTQAELAQRIGVQQPAIVKYENGDCMPPLTRAFRLAHALDCTVQELGLVDTGA